MLLLKWFNGTISWEMTILVGITKLNFLENLIEYQKIVTNVFS